MQNGCKISLVNPQRSSALWEAQAEASGKGADVWLLCFPGTGGSSQKRRAGAVEMEPLQPLLTLGACELQAAGMFLP